MDDCEYTELTCDDIARLGGIEVIKAASYVVNEDGFVSQRVVFCNT